jgi:adenylate kinase
MVREAMGAATPLGRDAKRYYDAGELVPDDVIIGLVDERLSRPDTAKGFVLDGFPRTEAQADALDRLLARRGLTLDRVVLFEIGEEELVRRLSGRRTCVACGRNYHVVFAPPTRPDRCDGCGAALVQRPDDDETTVRNRLAVYARSTKPLIAYYERLGLLESVQAGGRVEAVFDAVLRVTERPR